MIARVRTHLLVAGMGAICSQAAFGQGQIVINEVVYDNAGSDTHCWLELKGPGGTSLNDLEVVGINGNGGAVYQIIPLTGQSIPADGYFVISQDGTTPNSDMIDTDVNYQNGPDNIQLRVAATGQVLDALGYGTFGGTDVFAGEGSPAPGQTNDISLARCPDGSDTNDNSVDFLLDPDPTPGTPNDGDCGGPGDPTPYTICELIENDANGVPIHLNEYVIVRGVTISPNGIFSASTNDVKITDGECCITIFGGSLMPIAIGDELEVIGTLAQFNGLTEISNPLLEIEVVSTGNPIPAPTVISTAEFNLNGEDYESCLIGFSCVDITGGTWPAQGQNQNLTIDDGSGPATMRIDADTDIDGSPEPTGSFSVVGVGGQFDSSAPHDSGYQMFPRFLSDFDFNDPACADPVGACCFQDGTCAIFSETDCFSAGGVWQGKGTSCEPDPCIILDPVGACCLPDGTCREITEDRCGGLWLGEGSTCDPNPCVQPVGACCFTDGTCLVTSANECAAVGGSYQGDGSTCDPNPCSPVPTIDSSWGKIKNRYGDVR